MPTRAQQMCKNNINLLFCSAVHELCTTVEARQLIRGQTTLLKWDMIGTKDVTM